MNRAAAFLLSMFHVVQGRFEGRNDRGATAVEYGLMVGLIAVAIIVAVTALGGQLKELFNNVSTELTKAKAA
ncbi:Flp family type IVb pilin [Georgenia ruanii]|uniref:Flp family type IVb pilin n=1 Tax=Georgenia ruanii TaxID=348442 RepID=UPI0012656451|nr:Flp family type IVb pilin [Georgenia ruanii]